MCQGFLLTTDKNLCGNPYVATSERIGLGLSPVS